MGREVRGCKSLEPCFPYAALGIRVVQWWGSFACPGSQAKGKRYYDWDGYIERITQLHAWSNARSGS
jgi:hypothetical protein